MNRKTTRAFQTLKTTPFLIALVIAAFASNVFAQNTAERIILEPKETEMVDRSDKASKPKIVETVEKISSNELITAITYALVVGSSALHDMSSGTTQLIGPNVDDTASAVTNIGFDFWYDGVRYTQFSCNANGVCRLGPTVVGTTFTNSLASVTNAPKIAPYFDDLWVGTNGKVHYKVINVAPNRELVVEWSNMQIPRVGTGVAGAGTFQMTLNESAAPVIPGAIRFFYGTGVVVNSANSGYSIGIQSGAATNFASITSATDTVSYAAATDTQTNAITANKVYGFNPNIPAAPSNNGFTVTATTATVNWLDNATNEVGYVVYRSTDFINFTFITQLAAGSTSYMDTGLTPSTSYVYTVQAVTEGALSPSTSFGVTTSAAGNDTCNGAGGLWSVPATWTDGSVPTSADNVTIGTGCTVTIDSSNAFSVTVQSGGILQFEDTTARTLTVGGNVTIDAGGTFQSGVGGTQTGHVLSVAGSITNNGTLDFSTNGNTAGANITFAAGGSNVTFGGTGGTTDIRGITVAKGAQAIQVEMLMLNLSVQGVTTDVGGFLTLTSGTFKISGNFTMTNRIFPTATYTIPVLGGLWINNPNFTVAAQAGGTTCANNGLFRMTAGVYNIGVTGADGMGGGAGATFIVEGGTINATRFDPQSAVSFTMTNGTMNISPTVGNTRSNFASFELFSTTSSFTMSGGTINLIQAATPATPIDWQVLSNPATVTGGTLNVGTAATATNFNFRIRGSTPSLVVDNTTNNKTATFTAQTLIRGNTTVNAGTTFAINGFLVAPTSTDGTTKTFTNNGTITGNVAGSRFYFLGTGAGSGHIYTGTGTAGAVATPLISVDFDSVAGVNLSAATNNLITNRVILFTGNVTGAGKLELGVGGASTGTTQVGNTTTPTNAGTFDAPFTFNLGTGGQVASYLRTTNPYTTGGEVNPTRTLTTMNVDPNILNNIVVGGGNLTVTGTFTLTTGSLLTSSANTLIHNGPTATRGGTCTVANCYVDGPLARSVAVAAYTFHVGENGYSPVLVNTTALGTASTLTVEAFDATLAGFNPPTSLSRNWSLTESGDITADLSFIYNTDALDVNGNEADYRVYRREGPPGNVVTNMCSGGPCVNVGTNTLGPVTGVTTFSRWTGAENQVPVAAAVNIGGRVTQADGLAGISKAQVTISGGNLPAPRTVITNPFGYYVFEELQVGSTYVLTVGSKQYTFINPSIVVTPTDNVGDANFYANP